MNLLAAFVIVAVLTGSARAAGRTGSGQGDISGYAVSDVHFDLSAERPTTITVVTFSLEPEPSPAVQVSAEIADIRYPCILTLPVIVCRPAGAAALLSEANSLTVTAGP